MPIDFKNALNIPTNAILPFDPRRYKLVVGSAEYVAIEVIIAKLFRMLLGASRKSWMELVSVHAVSLTYMGGAQGFMEPVGSLDADLLTQLKDGAKGIPAVFLAKYTVDTCTRGFHVPTRGWSINDILISAASKALSRPIFGLLYPYVKPVIGPSLELTNQMVVKQNQASTLNMGHTTVIAERGSAAGRGL